ncbi:MAG: CHASE2 domain-containing protein [Pseudomonadales bacterium]
MASYHPPRFLIALLLSVMIAGLLAWMDQRGLNESLELWAFDRVASVQPTVSAPRSQATLIWIGEPEISRYGHPLSDEMLARVLHRTLAEDPAAIGVDLYRDQPRPPGTAELRSVLLDSDRIFMAQKLADEQAAEISAPQYLPGSQVGFSDVPVDSDGTLRRLFLMLWDEADQAHLSLPLRLALRYLAERNLAITAHPNNSDWLQLGLTPMPPLHSEFGGYGHFDDRGYQYLFDPRSAAGLAQFSLTQLLEGEVPAHAIDGRMVVIATAAPSVKDQFSTALSVAEHGGLLHGIAADQLVRIAQGQQQPTHAWQQLATACWIFAWALLAAVLASLRLGKILQVTALLASAGTLFLWVWLAHGQALWLLLATPMLAMMFSALGVWSLRAWTDRRDKSALYALFGQFVSQPVLEEVWRDRHSWTQGRLPAPQLAAVTVLVADLSGFSERVNALAPDRLMRWMGQFMEAMAEQAEQHGGVVNDFTGDGVMVNFGAPVISKDPVTVANHAQAALDCAQSMCAALDELNASWAKEDLPPMRMRIGIASGQAVAGAYGSTGRMKYTTIGPPINLAARLESYDKDGFVLAGSGHRVLVAQQTIELLRQEHGLEPLANATLKGFDGMTQIYSASPAKTTQVSSDDATTSNSTQAQYLPAS